MLQRWQFLFRKLQLCVDLISGKFIFKVRSAKSTPRGRALLIYIAYPFWKKTAVVHSNIREVPIIADLLAERGYDVDVIDFRSEALVSFERYSVIFGFGDLFEEAVSAGIDARCIFYATQAPQWIHNLAEAKRIVDFQFRTGTRLKPRRMLDRTWPASAVLSDAIVCVTDGWAYERYRELHQRVYSVPITAFGPSEIERTSYSGGDERVDFVWFGSTGALHKGLDLCIEAVSQMSDVVLNVCGSVLAEKDFMSAIQRYLTGSNVKFLGRIDPLSSGMRNLMRSTGFVVLPSASEGCATGVLTCMAWGCVPVITEYCGISFPEAVRIRELTVESVTQAIRTAKNLPAQECRRRSEKARAWAAERHTSDEFAKGLKRVLADIGI